MPLDELLERMENSDRIWVIKDGKRIFVGWLAILTMHNAVYEKIRKDTVKKIRAIPEIRHRKWKELRLMKPLQPDETPMYMFKDLQMELYYAIYL